MYYPCGIRCQIIYQPNGMKPSPSQQYAGTRDSKLDVYLPMKAWMCYYNLLIHRFVNGQKFLSIGVGMCIVLYYMNPQIHWYVTDMQL